MLSGPVIIPLGHLPPSQSLSHAFEYPTEPICRNASMFTFVSFLKLFFVKNLFLLNYPIATICRTASSPSHLPIFRHCLLLCFLPPMLAPLLHPLVLWRKKIIQRAYFSQKKTSPIFNFSPNKFADFDFQIDENFSFQRPASQQNCLYVSCDDSK